MAREMSLRETEDRLLGEQSQMGPHDEFGSTAVIAEVSHVRTHRIQPFSRSFSCEPEPNGRLHIARSDSD
jgi:hypothetical protein